jgi:hypothetical protein
MVASITRTHEYQNSLSSWIKFCFDRKILWDITANNLIQNFIPCLSLKVKSIYRWNYWGSSVSVSTRDWSDFLHSSGTGEKMGAKWECDSVRRGVSYNIHIEFGVPMKLVRLIKMCLKETYSSVYIGKHLSDSFPIQNSLKQGDALSPLLFNLI